MAPKETIIYYDFSDVLACASTGSTLSLSSDETDSDDSTTSSRQPFPMFSNHRRQLSYNLQVFDIHQYHNMEHKWIKKPFVVRSMHSLQLCRPKQRLDTIVHRNRAKLDYAGCWDPEGLVLTDANNPFKSKVYMSINNVSKVPKGKKVEYLSGTYLSKVFVGDHEDIKDWVDHVSDTVVEKYPRTCPRQWLAFYPTELQHPRPSGHSVIAFFIKVSE